MKKWQVYSLWIFGIISLIVSSIMLYLFIWHKKEAGIEYAVATEQVGQYGDFIGGVIGTFLSIILLYFTLTLQREDSSKNSNVYNAQQLNDEFFHLIGVYNDILKGFEFDGYVGKMAIHKSLEDMYDEYDSELPSPFRRKSAVMAYLGFYARERNFAPVYFRTLYRICQIIDENACKETKKVEYMKILRAQLTDSELILMRYNAMTPLGKKFTTYINKYNLLKHIPIFMLLEYKIWRRELANTSDAFDVSHTLQLLKEWMSDFLKSEEEKDRYVKRLGNKKYQIRILCSKKKDKMILTFIRKTSVALGYNNSLRPFDLLPFEDLTNLLRYYMKDCFVLSTFNQLNSRKELELDYECKVMHHDMEVITTWVRNKTGKPLLLTSNIKADNRS